MPHTHDGRSAPPRRSVSPGGTSLSAHAAHCVTPLIAMCFLTVPDPQPLSGQDAANSAVAGVNAVRLHGRATHRGAPGTFDAVVRSDGSFWWRVSGALSEEVWFDGRNVTARDANGTVAVLAGRARGIELMLARLIGAVRTGDSLRGSGPLPFAESRTVANQGRVDDSTHAISVQTLQGLEEFRGSLFRTAAGVAFASHIVHRVAGFERLRVEVDEAHATPASALPTPGAHGAPLVVRFRNRGLSPLVVQAVQTGQLLVRIQWNGAPGWWILDTGASETVVDSAAAQRAGVTPVGRSLVTSMFGQSQVPVFRLSGLDLGPVHLDSLAAVGTDLAPLASAIGVPLIGVIGYDLLARSVIEFGAGHRTILIGPPDAAPTGVPWRPMVLLDRHPAVDGAIEGRIRGLFRLDTGAGPALITNRWISDETDLLADRATTAFAGAPFDAVAGRLNRLELGGLAVDSVTTLFVTGGSGPIAAVFSDRDLVGNVGSPILSEFRIVLDYTRGRVALIPR